MTKNGRPAWRDAAIAAVALIVVLAIPFLHRSPAFEDFIIRLSAMALFATSLNLLVGNAGMVSFGHGMFYGLGAYAFALTMQMTELSLPVAAVLAVLVTTAAALCVGAICVRLGTDYFAFITLAFQMLLYSVIISWQSLTGGDQGLRGGIPRPPFLGINLANQSHLYLTSCALLIMGLILMHHLVQSPFGYTLRMIRDNATRANFLGIAAFRVRLTAFVLAGIFAGAGGVIMSLFVSGAYPEFAYWTISGEGIFIIMLGGLNSFLGPVVGTIILLLLNDFVTRFTEYYGLTLGIIILLFALGLRRGLLDVVLDGWRRYVSFARAGVKQTSISKAPT
jgi:branched-chain amino acid transport system permease protein